MTTRKLTKGRGKKQSRRVRYGGMKEGMIYQSKHEPDVILTTDGDIVKTPKKSSNQKYWLFGGGLLVALVVGITVPLVLSKNK